MTRRRKLLGARHLPLVGGALALDFVNTTGARLTGEPRERLRTPEDLAVWARRAGIPYRRVGTSSDGLRRVREAREILYLVLRALADGAQASRTALRRLDTLCRRDRVSRELVVKSGLVSLEPAGVNLADRVISLAIDSAMSLVLANDHGRLKRCAECDWLFLDDTKNQSRLWCKKLCGDRVRARRHYARLRRG